MRGSSKVTERGSVCVSGGTSKDLPKQYNWRLDKDVSLWLHRVDGGTVEKPWSLFMGARSKNDPNATFFQLCLKGGIHHICEAHMMPQRQRQVWDVSFTSTFVQEETKEECKTSLRQTPFSSPLQTCHSAPYSCISLCHGRTL